MVERTETNKKTSHYIKTSEVRKKIIDFDAIVSTNDTIVIEDVTLLGSAHLAKKSDGSEVDCTVATNVITVTEADLTNVPVVGSAWEG